MSTQPNLSIPIEVTVAPQAVEINLELARGLLGPAGDDATITVGTTTTGAPGTDASVTNSGTPSDAVLDFTIPRGDVGETGPQGPQGETGAAATVAAGSTTTSAPGTSASVVNAGTASAAVFNFTIPRGDVGATGATGATGAQGVPGIAATVDAGTTSTTAPGTNALVANVGTTSAAVFDFQIPRGDVGPQGIQGIQGIQGVPGDAATIAVGSTTTGAPGTSASVSNSGTSSAAVFDFTIPEGQQGDQGAQGPPGDAATVSVGTVTTVGPGFPAQVQNAGTGSAAVFDFWIPEGQVGATGAAGDSFTWQGAWNDSSAYQLRDVVYFNGSSFICVVAIPAGPGNLNPTQTSDWELMVQKGDTGAAGADGDRYTTTSTTSLTNSNGTKVLTIEPGLAYIPEQGIIIASSTLVDTHMHGTVVSYNSVTGELVADVTQHTGLAGPYSAWDVSLSGAVGAQGPAGTAATIEVGSVTTGIPGSAVTIINSGTSSAAVFDFSIPQGATGATGSFVGDAATITTGTLSNARLSPSVTILGNSTTGGGSIVLATSPVLTTPNIGAATGNSLTVSQAAWDQLNLTVSSYPGTTGNVLKVTPHNGTEPLTVRGSLGYNGAYSTRADSLRTSYLGFGTDLSSATCTALLLKDSRLSVSYNGTVGPFTAYTGFDASDIRLFNAYTNASNYERGNLYWTGNVLTIGTEAAGTGTVRGFAVAIGGTTRFAINTSGEISTGAWHATAIAIAHGGTGATDAPTARTNLGLGNVENTALSTWAGSSNLTTLGTVSTGVWQGTPVAIEYGGTGAVTAPLARAALGLGNVENVALSTWAGSANLSTVGTITTGTWNGTAVAIAHGGTGATTDSDARTNLGLGNVENTALSTWAGSGNLTTLGTITSGIWNGSAVAITHGGTGAANATDARDNLGLEIGVDVQGFVSATSTGTGAIVLGTSPAIATPTLSGYRLSARTITTSTTLLASDSIVLVSAAGGGVAITLPPAADVPGQVFEIKRTDGSVNTIVVSDPTSSIDGEAAAYIYIQFTSLTVASNGSAYFIL